MGTTTGTKRRRPRILVAGLGNLLLRDDGVGVHAVGALAAVPLPGVILADVGTAVLDALHLFEWADKILALDAMQAGGPPGTIYACETGDVADDALRGSLHGLSLLAGLRFMKRKAAPEILIIGVEPGCIGYGLDLTPPVAAAMPRLLKAARDVVARWRNGNPAGPGLPG